MGFDYSKTNSSEYPNQMNVISRGLATPPTQKKYNEDGTPTKGYNATSPNPLWYQYYNDQSKEEKRMSAFGRLTYHIIEGLKADVQMLHIIIIGEVTVSKKPTNSVVYVQPLRNSVN